MFSAGLRANGAKTATKEKRRRLLKSPYQLMALENFYKEHKYPSEEMRVELGEEIGLTVQQVSSWFCFRRVKDKPLVKNEVNNMGNQGRGSGDHQQDSCGSTKQTGYENLKPREVESQRLYEKSFEMENVDGADRSSSESSSSSHGHHLVPNNYGVPDVSHNRVVTPLHPQVVRSCGHKPSGYLKVKSVTEIFGIIAVKRRLGRHYHEDGPPLALDFDPLPPGAFEFPTKDVVQEPICFGNQRRSHSPYGNSNPGSRYSTHNSEIYSLDPYVDDDDDIAVGNGSGFRDKQRHQEPGLKPPTHYGTFTDQNSFEEMCKGSPRECSLNYSKKSWIMSKHGAESVNLVPLGDSMKRGPSSGMPVNYYGERNYKLLSLDEPRVAKQVKQGYIQQRFKRIQDAGGQRRGN